MSARFVTMVACSLLIATFSRATAEPLSRLACSLPVPEIRQPVIDAREFGAVGDGNHDDAPAINAAIASLEHGGTVQFSPGFYRHDDVIKVERPDVHLVGRGATLVAGNPGRSATILVGDRSGIWGLAITTIDPGERGDRDEQSGIVVRGSHNSVLGVTVSRSKGAGIMVIGGRDFLIGCSDVISTKSDGIHVTGGSTIGRIVHNSVWNSEDDGIAVVSYRRDAQSTGIVIEDNSVEHIRWGRGISIVGSADSVIRRNDIRAVAMAAGIIVAREAYWNTYGVKNILIEENTISDIQLSLAPLEGRERTGQAAIDLNSDDEDASLAVSEIKVVGNSVRGSRYGGVRLLGNVYGVSVIGNVLGGLKGPPVAVIPNRPKQLVECRDNSVGPPAGSRQRVPMTGPCLH